MACGAVLRMARGTVLMCSTMLWLRVIWWFTALACCLFAAWEASHFLCLADVLYILYMGAVCCILTLEGLIVHIAVHNRKKRKRHRSRICWGFRRHNCSCMVSTALIIANRRGRARCPEHMPFLFVVFRPGDLAGNFLKGGGSKKSQSSKQITELAQCVKQLTQAVGAIQAQLRGHDSPTENSTKIPRRKQRKSKSFAKPVGQPTLWDTLEALFLKTQTSGKKPSDNSVRVVLQSVLNEKEPKNEKAKPKSKASPVTNQEAPFVNKSQTPMSWADIVGKPTPPRNQQPQSKPLLRLFGPSWPAPVVYAHNIEQQHIKTSEPLVVCAENQAAKGSAANWLAARGMTAPCTFVILNPPHDSSTDTVLVEGRQGPIPKQVLVTKSGPDAPAFQNLPGTFKDDEARDGNSNSPSTVLLRLTVAKQFADPQMVKQAVQKPVMMPALIMPTLRNHILQTRGAIAYDTEVTCLIRIKEDKVPLFLSAKLPVGAFCNPQKSQKLPTWFKREEEQTWSAYWANVSSMCTSVNGRLVYRPSQNAPIGILHDNNKGLEKAIPMRWFLHGAPFEWTGEEVKDWAIERGFTNIDNPIRFNNDSWFFRAHSPNGVTLRQAFCFKSGITVGPAKAKQKNIKGKKDPHKPAKTVWGATKQPIV